MKKQFVAVILGPAGISGAELTKAMGKLKPKSGNPDAENRAKPLQPGEVAHLTR